MFSIESGLSKKMVRIFESMNDGIIFTDKDTRVIYINNAFAHYSGVNPEDIKGKILREVRTGSRLHEALRAGIPMINVKRYESGFESYCDLLPVRDEEENIIAGLVIVKDARVIKKIKDVHEKCVAKVYEIDRKIKGLFTAHHTFESIVAIEPRMQDLVSLAKTVSKSDSSILMTGESGTGKEVFAQAIHNWSLREFGPFVPINCSSIPENLWESEFFGYESGAFTGAHIKGKIGYFELANGGTLFLDEVGEIPLRLQAKLLRVIEEGVFMKVGGKEPISSNVRIIAATNRDLESMRDKGEFRKDLFYRLSVVPLTIPPLRERKADIPQFVRNFLSSLRTGNNIVVDPKALNALIEYEWPGNVRELRNAIEYSLNFLVEGAIVVEGLPSSIQSFIVDKSLEGTLRELVSQYERNILLNEIRKKGDSLSNRRKVAEKFGISLATLYKKLSVHSQKQE